VKDNTLTWLDTIDSKGKVNSQGNTRDLLWMCCVLKTQNIEEWKMCLTAPCPNIHQDRAWLNWVAHRVFKMTLLKEDPVELDKVIEAYNFI
jgi:hypothetical protein